MAKALFKHGRRAARDPARGTGSARRRPRSRWLERLLPLTLFCLSAAVVFWFALVHTIHRGTQTVPDLRGKSVEQARTILHDRSLALKLEQPGVFSAKIPVGVIAQQEPAPGFHVKSGATVTVRLSLGGERVEVPDVRGESIQGAAGVIEQVGLLPGRRVEVDGGAEGNTVIATDPPIGAAVPPSTRVDILLNQAPNRALWVMPSLLSHSLGEVRRFCRRHRFRLGQVHAVSYPGVPAGRVLRQYPPAGSPLASSDIITVWVSQ